MALRNVIERGRVSGLDYLIVGLSIGHRCGYVRLPEGHPWHDVSSEDEALDDDEYRAIQAKHPWPTFGRKQTIRTTDYVRAECKHLAEQIAEKVGDPRHLNPGEALRAVEELREKCDLAYDAGHRDACNAAAEADRG